MIRARLKIVSLLVAVALSAAIGASAQATAKPDKYRVEPPAPPEFIGRRGESSETSERSIKVDPRVNLSFCVAEGTVNINGWARDEIRIFVKDGSGIGFNVLQKSRQDQSPVWVKAVGVDADGTQPGECLWGKMIEIDLPRNAAVSLKGKETRTSIDSIRKASVENIGGDIVLRNITEGANASTYQGDVAVENVDGAISLKTDGGNIIAVDVAPSQVGDIFKARTSGGAISLQRIEHRQLEVNSISGSVLFNGSLLSGGTYTFGTTNGSINLALPQDASCKISATYGFGNFDSELPVKLLTENVTPGPIKHMVGTLGTGDAALNLITSSGRILIRKQQP
jgi:hypothetical protein